MEVGAHAEQGVFDDRILFGQSAAFDGPAAALGLGMREGILASFNEANAAGGINGHRLELVSYDDGYEPERAIANTKRLISEGVFALVGEVGTPTSSAAQPIATEAGVPFIGPFTGAAFLRDPSLGNVINVRASYDLETGPGLSASPLTSACRGSPSCTRTTPSVAPGSRASRRRWKGAA
jgi:ABC-type branched-subunit amino acid transport system substrate-binding protein